MKTLPIKKNLHSIFKLLSIAVIVFSTISLIIPQSVWGLTLEQELTQVKKELESIRNNKKVLESEINKEKSLQNNYDQELVNLKNKINLLSNKIDEKTLVIKELEIEIDILTTKLNETKAEITVAEGELSILEEETNSRLVDIYLSQKTFSDLDILISPDGQADIIKFNLYHNSIQDATNTMVSDLKGKRSSLEEKKKSLEEDKIEVQRDEVQLQEELVSLEKDETDLATQRSNYFAKKQQSLAKVENNSNKIETLTEEEKEAIAEITKLEQILFNSISAIPNGSPVKKGTIIGQQGCTGHCTGPHTHYAVSNNGVTVNPCSVLPSGVIGGCGVSSSSIIWPQNGSFYISSDYGNRGSSFHGAIDIANTISNAPIYASHDGYIVYGVSACNPSLTRIWGCNPPGGKYAVICENKNCNIGFKTMYLHLK